MRLARALILLLLVSCTSPVVGAVRTDPSSAQTLFSLTNETRDAQGVPPLVFSGVMARYAEAWSAQMASRGDAFHSSLPDGVMAENVASWPLGPGWEQRLHQAFLESKEHRLNILDRRLKTLGIAVVISDGFAFVTEEFGLGEPEAKPAPTCKPIVRTDCSYRFTP